MRTAGFVFALLLAATAAGQAPDRAYAALSRAFDSLRAHQYDSAIDQFREAEAISPERADIRKNLAYTLLKTGDSEAARIEFGAAMKNDPTDPHVALEYAFLCYEATADAPARKAEARRIFARARDAGGTDAETRATAARAFENIDAPLGEGIARWQKALSEAPPTFSAHFELAQLAEARDEPELAATHYRAAFEMLPERKSVLLDLARVEKARGNAEGATAALLAASRGPESRAAEMAREQLPDRYPYVYEFREALELDPKNAALRRELAYLLLQMSEKDQASRADAIEEFRRITEDVPGDTLAATQLGLLYLGDKRNEAALPILQKVLNSGDVAAANRVRLALNLPTVLEERKADEVSLDPRILGEKSYAAGFLKDAKRYFLAAHEANPLDDSLALKLGWTSNMLHDDGAALGWFNSARKSNDPAVADEAQRAYDNLRPDFELFRTTVWMYPLYSSRWRDAFGYGQVKTELRLRRLPFHVYASLRVAGDVRRTSGGIAPQSLSESAVIPAVGVTSNMWHGATGWFEAGSMVSYLTGSATPDYRGGLSYTRTHGISLSAERSGWFFETTEDSVFISKFNHDLISYSQNKAGFTSGFLGLKTQVYWNNNVTFDVKRQYWANTFETGPGLRFRLPAMPKGMNVTVSAMRGVYLRNEGNPRGPNYIDLRAGVWYAFTR